MRTIEHNSRRAIMTVVGAMSVMLVWPGAMTRAQGSANGAKPFVVGRTPDGQPDLQGFWTAEVAGTYDLTDPRGGEIRVEEVAQAARGVVRRPNASRVIDPPDGQIPYQPWAAAKHKDLRTHADSPTKP